MLSVGDYSAVPIYPFLKFSGLIRAESLIPTVSRQRSASRVSITDAEVISAVFEEGLPWGGLEPPCP